MDDLFKFDVALERLVGNEELRCFAFFPTKRKGDIVGGTIFVLERYHDDDEVSYIFFTEGGLFFSSSGDEDSHDPDDFDDIDIVKMYGVDPRILLYKLCTKSEAISASGMQTEFAVAIINGRQDLVPSSIQEASSEWLAFLTQHVSPSN